MGCCSSNKGFIQDSQKLAYQQESLKVEKSLNSNDSQEKYQEQQQEQETCGKPNLKTKKFNQLISFKVEQDIIQNKDNLNAVDDDIFALKNQSNLFKIERRNSDSDY